MNQLQRLAALVLPSVFVLSISPATAAAFKTTAAACRDKAVFKQAFQSPTDKEGKKAAAYFQTKLGTGECSQFARGQQVTVDERDGGLWCVRPSGGLDCYWTIEKAVDLNPPAPSTTGAGAGAGGASHPGGRQRR
jgi:hypothetical protein